MNLLKLEGLLTVVTEPVHVRAYDFRFDHVFQCTFPTRFETPEPCVLRIGAIQNYAQQETELADLGLHPINSARQYLYASELSHWYPLIADMTPKSVIQDDFPTSDEVQRKFGWPVFIKGSRQTSRHDPSLSVARDVSEYDRIIRRYREDPILRWQRVALRQFVELMPVTGHIAGKIRPSMEFRTFWWRRTCVGTGRYWTDVPKYDVHDLDRGIALASKAAERLDVPFLVIDIAKTVTGEWLVIECNDAQESGYAGVNPLVLWRNVLDLHRKKE